MTFWTPGKGKYPSSMDLLDNATLILQTCLFKWALDGVFKKKK